jgi:hypothetical protein
MASFGTFTSGQILTAAELNSAGEWQTYTPTWTQNVAITKTVNWARYTVLNKWVQGSVKMTASSAGTANNKILVGLPVAASSSNFIIGISNLFDASSTNDFIWSPASTYFETSTTMSFQIRSSIGAVTAASEDDKRMGQNYALSGTVTGFTLDSGDIIYIQFAYEAA